MNNDTGENGERRESHRVTLQWCSRDQSKTMALSPKWQSQVAIRETKITFKHLFVKGTICRLCYSGHSTLAKLNIPCDFSEHLVLQRN